MENSQQKIRHIPIFVEGRDEPVINRGHDECDSNQLDHSNLSSNANQSNQSSNNNTSAFASAESSSSGPFHQNHSFGRPQMNFPNDIGGFQDIPMSSGASIFDRAKDFPVRDFFSSARRSESPISNVHRTPSSGSKQQSQSQERSVPVQKETNRSSTPNRPMWQQSHPNSQQQQKKQEVNESQTSSMPAKQKAIEESITKIQKIQQSVMDLMERVEKYDGANSKEYLYLDEMLTQNLLKLDNIDAEGKDNIKNARREAIKCINHLISILEMKKDEALCSSAVENKKDNTEVVNATSRSAEESLEEKINAASANNK